MDYPRCKTCKWWDQNVDPEEGWGRLRPEQFPDDWGGCLRTNEDKDESTSLARTFMFEQFYYEPLMTSPEFGCLQHEPKEDV
jgi:hypothetical protein